MLSAQWFTLLFAVGALQSIFNFGFLVWAFIKLRNLRSAPSPFLKRHYHVIVPALLLSAFAFVCGQTAFIGAKSVNSISRYVAVGNVGKWWAMGFMFGSILFIVVWAWLARGKRMKGSGGDS